MGLFNNSSINLFSIGNAYNYAKSYVNSLKAAGKLTTGANSGTTAQDTIKNTSSNTASFTKQNTANLSKLQSASSSLSAAARSLGSGVSSLVSSDDKVVSSSSSLYSKSDMSFDVSVSRLATQQMSQSGQMNSSDKSEFDTGQNSIRLLTENGSYAITFDVGAKDTNKDTLNSIAKSVNSANAGVTASVVSENGKSRIQFTSQGTGRQNAFAFEDLNGSNAATRMDMQTTQQAQDASYSVNGKNYTSGENTVSVPDGRGATMTLKGAGSASLNRGVDASKLVDAAQNFASAYNSAMSHLASGKADGAGVYSAMRLIGGNRMTSMSASNYGAYASSRLSSMGITIDNKGKMQVDSEKLTKAAKQSPATVQSALSGYGGLADTTKKNAEEAMRIPSAKYTNFSNMGAENSLISALMPRSGSLFDMLR